MMKFLAVAALFLCCAAPAAAAGLDELTPYFGPRYFSWKERSGGKTLLKEHGPLFCAGVRLGSVTSSSVAVRARAEVFGGEVSYEGQTQAPESVPVDTHVSYYGAKGELDLGYRLDTGPARLEPFAGVGYQGWFRDLQDSTASDGTSVYGYTEGWQVGYARIGARADAPLGRVRGSAEAGAKYPFYVGNTIDFSGSGKTTFHPKGRMSGFAELGAGYGNFRAALVFDALRFARSDLKPVNGTYYFQPDSSSDSFGLRLGWNF